MVKIAKKKSLKKLIIISFILVVFAIMVILGLRSLKAFIQSQREEINWPPPAEVGQSSPQSFATQEECVNKTGKRCFYYSCDYAPSEKNIEDTCGKNFKGWQPQVVQP